MNKERHGYPDFDKFFFRRVQLPPPPPLLDTFLASCPGEKSNLSLNGAFPLSVCIHANNVSQISSHLAPIGILRETTYFLKTLLSSSSL